MREPTVLFVTDLEGDVDGGLALASRFAAERAATLLILHVVPLRVDDGEGMLHRSIELAGGAAERALSKLAPADPSVPFVRVLEVGDPEERVLVVARRERAEMIVVEHRRRSALRRVLSRDLGARLAALAPCPVVMYRAQAPGPSAPAPAPAPRHPVEVMDQLSGLLNARVDALCLWMAQRQGAVASIAERAGVGGALGVMVGARPARRSAAGRARSRVELELREHQRALGAVGVALEIDGATAFREGVGARDDGARAAFYDRLERLGVAISLPLDAEDGHACVMLVGARVDGPAGARGALVFTIDARRDFLRILAQPGPTASTETYAFDAAGLMLSNSRFPEQLRRLGLLPADAGEQTPRRLLVVEPERHALTRMAADAVLGHDGQDHRGYVDYRGVKVVGAWRWVHEHGFGVAAEMDLDG